MRLACRAELDRCAWRVFFFSGGEFRPMPERVDDLTLAVTASEVVIKSLTFVVVNQTRGSRPSEYGDRLNTDRPIEDPRELTLEHRQRPVHVPPVSDELDVAQTSEPVLNDLHSDSLRICERAVAWIEGRNDHRHACVPGTDLEAAYFIAIEGVPRDEKRKTLQNG